MCVCAFAMWIRRESTTTSKKKNDNNKRRNTVNGPRECVLLSMSTKTFILLLFFFKYVCARRTFQWNFWHRLRDAKWHGYYFFFRKIRIYLKSHCVRWTFIHTCVITSNNNVCHSVLLPFFCCVPLSCIPLPSSRRSYSPECKTIYYKNYFISLI